MYNSLKKHPIPSKKFTQIYKYFILSPSKNYNNLHFVSIFGELMTFFAHKKKGGGYCAMCQLVLLYSFLAKSNLLFY